MTKRKNPSKAVGKKKPTQNPPERWAKLVRRGNLTLLAEPSCSTATVMKHDYSLLSWNLRQYGHWVDQKKERGEEPTVEDAKKAFGGTILVGDEKQVGYLTDSDLRERIERPLTPSTFAKEIIAKVWPVQPSTAETYLRHRQPRTKPRKA
jgi:hypothetical protein